MEIIYKTKLKSFQNMDNASNLHETIAKNLANRELLYGEYILKMWSF